MMSSDYIIIVQQNSIHFNWHQRKIILHWRCWHRQNTKRAERERERKEKMVGETRHRWNYRHWHFGFIISDAEKSPYRSSTDKMPTKWHTPKCDTRDATLYAAVHTQNNIRFAFFSSPFSSVFAAGIVLRAASKFVCVLHASRKINTSSKSINSQSGSKLCSNQYFIHLAEMEVVARYSSHCSFVCVHHGRVVYMALAAAVGCHTAADAKFSIILCSFALCNIL